MKTKKAIIGALGALLLAFALAGPTKAATLNDVNFVPQVSVPNSQFQAGVTYTMKEPSLKPLGEYIIAIFNYGLAIVGILAAIILMAGGLIWLTSGGSSSKVGQAKELMLGSIVGLLILVVSWVILNTINPELVNFRTTAIPSVEKVVYGCCQSSEEVAMVANRDCAMPAQFYEDSLPDYATNTCQPLGCCELTFSDGSYYLDALASACAHPDSQTAVFHPHVTCTDYLSTKAISINVHVVDCRENKDGSLCYNPNGTYLTHCTCYYDQAWLGDAKLKEPCGNRGGSICYADNCDDIGLHHDASGIKYVEWGFLNPDIVRSGRVCGSGLECCNTQP